MMVHHQLPHHVQSLWAWMYFVAAIVLGSFLIINVFLANIMSSYSAGRARMHLAAARARARQKAVQKVRTYVKNHRRKLAIEEAEMQRKARIGLAHTTAGQRSSLQMGPNEHRLPSATLADLPPRARSREALPSSAEALSKPLSRATGSSAASASFSIRDRDRGITVTSDVTVTSLGRNASSYLRRLSQDVHIARAAHLANSILAAGYGGELAAAAGPAGSCSDPLLQADSLDDASPLVDARLARIVYKDALPSFDTSDSAKLQHSTRLPHTQSMSLQPRVAAGIAKVGRRAFAELERTHSLIAKEGLQSLDKHFRAKNESDTAQSRVTRVDRTKGRRSSELSANGEVVASGGEAPKDKGDLAAVSVVDVDVADNRATSNQRPLKQKAARHFSLADVWNLREQYLRRLEDVLFPPRVHAVVLFKA